MKGVIVVCMDVYGGSSITVSGRRYTRVDAEKTAKVNDFLRSNFRGVGILPHLNEYDVPEDRVGEVIAMLESETQ